MSGTYTITNLQPNTTYNIKTQIRRTDSGLWTESSNLSVATYDIAKITSIPPTTIGNNVTVTYTNPSGNPVEIGLFIDKEDTPIINYQSATGGNHTFEFTEEITAYLYSLTTSSISKTLQFYIKTTQGDKSYSTFTDGVFNVDLELNKPNFNNFNYLDVNPITTSMTQNLEKIVLNYSDIKVKIPVEMRATAKNEAHMLRYEVQCGNIMQTLKYSDYAELEVTFKKATSNVITVKAIDSRGIATTVRKEAEFVNYQSPFISEISFERENGIGTKAFFKINGTWDTTHFSRFTNPSEVYFRYKKLNFGEYSPWINMNGFNGLDVNEYEGTIKNKTDNSNWIPDISKGSTYEKMGESTYDMYTKNTYTDFSGDKYNPNKYLEFEIGVEYNIEFKIVDKLEEYILGNILSSGIPCVDKVKKSDGTYSIGINCFADEKYALKVLGKTNIIDYSALEKSVITLYASGRPEVTTTTNFQSIIFKFNKDLKIGSGLTRRTSDGAIIVNEDMYALVSAQVNLFSNITVGEVGIQILVNNEERIRAYHVSSTNYNCLTQSPTLLELHKNDVVQLAIRPQNQTTYHFFADDKFCTNLTVQQVYKNLNI